MTKITVEDIFLELYFGSLKKGKGFLQGTGISHCCVSVSMVQAMKCVFILRGHRERVENSNIYLI